jgi:hypothetical protein
MKQVLVGSLLLVFASLFGCGGADDPSVGHSAEAVSTSAAPGHIVCDPPPPPRSGCSWDEKTCEWNCPVCDPVGKAPHAGCSWNEKTCVWDCPVCDPPPPPEKSGCTWDESACVWICL